jgi:hypothetical protein
VLKQTGLLSRWKGKPSRKGTGFEQPLQPHQHWHVDVSYINPVGHVLLLMQRAGWMQSFSGALGSAGVDEGSGHCHRPQTANLVRLQNAHAVPVCTTFRTTFLRRRRMVRNLRIVRLSIFNKLLKAQDLRNGVFVRVLPEEPNFQ